MLQKENMYKVPFTSLDYIVSGSFPIYRRVSDSVN